MKYKIMLYYPNGETELLDEVFDDRQRAEEYALYNCSCYILGGEILHMSNPGDYPMPDEDDECEYEIIEVDA